MPPGMSICGDRPQVDDGGRTGRAFHGHIEHSPIAAVGFSAIMRAARDLLERQPRRLGGVRASIPIGLVILFEAVAPALDELVIGVQVPFDDVRTLPWRA